MRNPGLAGLAALLAPAPGLRAAQAWREALRAGRHPRRELEPAAAEPGGQAAAAAGAAAGRPPPFFLPLRAFWPRRMPPMPGMAPIIWRIIFWPSRNRTTSWLTSPTVTPEPLAMRTRREPFRIFGL